MQELNGEDFYTYMGLHRDFFPHFTALLRACIFDSMLLLEPTVHEVLKTLLSPKKPYPGFLKSKEGVLSLDSTGTKANAVLHKKVLRAESLMT
jgi:hypothetical protein